MLPRVCLVGIRIELDLATRALPLSRVRDNLCRAETVVVQVTVIAIRIDDASQDCAAAFHDRPTRLSKTASDQRRL
jgi:hypothetical protein